MAGVCAFLQAEKPVLGQDQKVFLALEAGFKQLDQPAQDTGGTLLPGPWLVSGGGVLSPAGPLPLFSSVPAELPPRLPSVWHLVVV